MSTPDETRPWFINSGGTPQIVIIWYLNGIPQLNNLGVYYSRVDINDHEWLYTSKW